MNNLPVVLVIGSGGREHALAWKLAHDSSRPRVCCAPGNAGTLACATNLPIEASNLEAIVQWSKEHRPRLVVIGPEAPLCAGLADRLTAAGVAVFGPSAAAAQLEGSKAFAKDVMQTGGVPTAEAASFDDPSAARDYIARAALPLVVKADGLAAGKGVFICTTRDEAFTAIEESMVRKAFGDSGRRVLIEEYLDGEEASILALVDGETVVPLASAQDHKRIFDGDRGPNTGGMGAYSPAPIVTPALMDRIAEEVFARTLAELKRRNIVYRGVLYAGLMLTAGGPKVLEFNCRFGDPETQAILPRFDGDLLPALEACAQGCLHASLVRWKPAQAVSVVLAAGGYPGPYKKGERIEGLSVASALPGVCVFHAGTRQRDGHVVTEGGRVLNVTALGATLAEAQATSYEAVARIHFNGMQYRRDIAWRALAKESS